MSSLAKAWAKWKTLIQAKVTSNRNELPPAVSVPRRTLGSEWRDFMITFSASRNPHAPPPKPPLSDIHLPIEVWEEVIAYVIKLRDLAALARTCKLLHYLRSCVSTGIWRLKRPRPTGSTHQSYLVYTTLYNLTPALAN
ncbi:hypothetical protein PIIN_06922 [Serendipita indica DSM 11827]|uniref:F-box domain-containing protein n=1 Tax=Serendipita indica (strain DSM 11827) TaxID=1109443 RepID=G4TNR4_SERID|nr:hypothetical protein PIIN_06922 [Serendipita indica DSM 11827]